MESNNEQVSEVSYHEIESVSFVGFDPPAGYYLVEATRNTIPVYTKPNWFRRLMMKWLLGIVYKDA